MVSYRILFRNFRLLSAIWLVNCLVEVVSETKICPPLPFFSLPNGQVVPIGYQKFRFFCDDGYVLGGPQQVRCYEGEWSSKITPTCWQTEDRCEPLPDIPNGYMLGGDKNKHDSVVHYFCNEGYSLLGNMKRTCLSNGFWSGVTPACMGDAEPLQKIAERFDEGFVKKMESYTNNDSVQSVRFLDKGSIENGLELVFLIDRSSSVDPHDLEIAKTFTKFLFHEFNVSNGLNPDGTRVAVIAFGSEVDVLINVDEEKINSSESASNALDELLQPGGGGTAMVPAFSTLIMRVMYLLRDNTKKAIFLISDGEPNIGGEGASPEEMAVDLKEYAGFEIFAMGVGPEVNQKLLASVASEPISSHVFLLRDYGDLSTLVAIIRNKPIEAPPVSPQKCGHFPDEKDTWPWLAAVYISVKTDQQPIDDGANNSTDNDDDVMPSKMKLCGGVLICSKWVLTAASCFFDVHGRSVSLDMEESFVVLGEYNLLKMDVHQENFYATDIIIHPDFEPLNILRNNIAVIKLDRPAKLGALRTICLPPTERSIPMHFDDSLNVTTAGWGTSLPGRIGDVVTAGYTRVSMTTKEVNLMGGGACRRMSMRKATDGSIFCATAKFPDQCAGITGSPLVAEDPGSGIYHVIGILSERKRCDMGQGEYTQLTTHVKWINKVTGKCHFKHWN